jgi:hypothetical protein
MPEAEPPIGEEERPPRMPPAPEPTEQDRENERIRREIADAQRATYEECLAWSVKAFGPGWTPSHKHCLIDKDEEARVRYTSEPPKVSATVYTIRKGDETRHFTVTDDGQVVEHASMEAGFGDLLLAPHPSRFVEHNGKRIACHRFSLCWAGFALYHPRSAEDLAKLRETRERKREERADRKFAQDHPLFAYMGLTRDGAGEPLGGSAGTPQPS